MQPHKKIYGLSLVELMVVVTLLSVFTMLAAPNMTEGLKNQRIRNAAESILNGLQMAKAEAINRNRPVGFWLVSNLTNDCTLSSNNGNWVISIDSPEGACAELPSTTKTPFLFKSYATQSNVSVNAYDKSSNPANEVRFDSYGRITNESPIMAIDFKDLEDITDDKDHKDKYRSMRIIIHGSGAIRLCDPRINAEEDNRKC